MIVLTIGGKTHDLSVNNAQLLALAIATETDKTGQPQCFQGTDTGFNERSVTTPPGKTELQTFSRAGIILTDC